MRPAVEIGADYESHALQVCDPLEAPADGSQRDSTPTLPPPGRDIRPSAVMARNPLGSTDRPVVGSLLRIPF